jgi:hypothetical protein
MSSFIPINLKSRDDEGPSRERESTAPLSASEEELIDIAESAVTAAQAFRSELPEICFSVC